MESGLDVSVRALWDVVESVDPGVDLARYVRKDDCVGKVCKVLKTVGALCVFCLEYVIGIIFVDNVEFVIGVKFVDVVEIVTGVLYVVDSEIVIGVLYVVGL